VSLLSRFLAANRRATEAIEARLPDRFRRHLHTLYKYEVAHRVNRRPGQLILDVGAGKECPFLAFVAKGRDHLVIGVDCSDQELWLNRDLDNKVVADAASPAFPFRDGSADLVVSRSVIEHLHDTEVFVRNCARVLRPGGALVHTFACKYAPFSLINQCLPNAFTRRLLAYFHPKWKDECGFVAFYRDCYFSRINNLLKVSGFANTRYECRYYQSIYFDFFVPLYLVSLAYDLTMWYLGIRNFACAILVTAEKPQKHPLSSEALTPDRENERPRSVPTQLSQRCSPSAH
jgi:ubiquinone/menaquinone biosynthesis C-methylase UbiE